MLVALEGCHERTSQVQRCTPSWLVRPRAVALVRYQLDVQYISTRPTQFWRCLGLFVRAEKSHTCVPSLTFGTPVYTRQGFAY